MASRVWGRLLVSAIASLPTKRKKKTGQKIERILVINHLLLGDTLMLTPLLKGLRHQYPQAQIDFVCPQAIAPLYASRPYGVSAKGFDPRKLLSILRLLLTSGGYDLAYVPGDNRWGRLAKAMRARWIVAFRADKPRKNQHIDQLIPMPEKTMTWGDMSATLIEPQPTNLVYAPTDWPAPAYPPFDRPKTEYIVLHLGASKKHKYWSADNWNAVAKWIRAQGKTVVWSTGKAETHLLQPIQIATEDKVFKGELVLSQLWQLLKQAQALICLDTGLAHLGRIVDVPTVTLFGPGSPLIFGAGQFWKNSRFVPMWHEEVPCRNRTLLFERDLPWVRQCWRGEHECAEPFCANLNQSGDVVRTLQTFLTAV